jgi:predicted Rossmann-fold nucleotide-binding protein
MPGGSGTLDEFFEIFTLVQTERIPQFPLILFGRDHWSGLLQWMKTEVEGKNKFISPGDLDLVTVTDDPQEAINRILDYERRVGYPGVMPKAFA